MIQLKNFPMRDQLKDVRSKDGSSPNAAYDCVPTSIAACIQYYTGKVVAADDILDAVYGESHRGGTSEQTFASYVANAYGLKLGYTPLPSASQAIIDHIRAELRAGHPVIVTMHSAWSTPWFQVKNGGLHVGVAYAIDETDAGNLHIMNPWHGFDHVKPVAWWRARLGNGVWPVSRIAAPVPVVTPQTSGQTSGLPDGWHDDGAILTAPNGQPIIHGFRAYVLDRLKAGTWRGGNPYTPEWSGGTFSVQPFASTLLLWDAQRNVYEGTMADALAIVAHEHQGKAA